MMSVVDACGIDHWYIKYNVKHFLAALILIISKHKHPLDCI
jgi:hypothetical protein